MTNRKIKEAGLNPFVGCKYVNKEVGERVGIKEGEKEKMSGKMSGKTSKVIIEIIKQNNEEQFLKWQQKSGLRNVQWNGILKN